MSLCRRCEHRAEAYSSLKGPRYQCTDFPNSIHSCYMYMPTKPAIIKRDNGDRRPQFTHWITSARSHFNGVCDDLKLDILDYGRKGKALIWVKLKTKV